MGLRGHAGGAPEPSEERRATTWRPSGRGSLSELTEIKKAPHRVGSKENIGIEPRDTYGFKGRLPLREAGPPLVDQWLAPSGGTLFGQVRL